MGEFDRATALIEEMHRLSLEHGLRNAGWALTMFGLIARDQGDYVRATSRFKESINWYRDKLDTWGSWWNVLGIATVASAQGRHRRAARIYGAVEDWQTSINLLRFPHNQRQFGKYMDATRAQLGDAAYYGIFEEGRAMTTEQAFQYALAND
jgi:non-specific serine/threonine protein kinase